MPKKKQVQPSNSLGNYVKDIREERKRLVEVKLMRSSELNKLVMSHHLDVFNALKAWFEEDYPGMMAGLEGVGFNIGLGTSNDKWRYKLCVKDKGYDTLCSMRYSVSASRWVIDNCHYDLSEFVPALIDKLELDKMYLPCKQVG